MLFKKTIKTGAIPDIKDERDFRFEEIGKVAPIEWIEKKEFKTYEPFDQDGSSSCVAQAVSKILGIENFREEGKFIHYSARDIYSRRSNKPAEGMYFREAMQLGHDYGATIEQLMPSQGLNETAMNNDSDRTPIDVYIAKAGSGGNYISLSYDMNAIANILNTGKGVILGFTWNYDEYDLVIPIIKASAGKYCHCVAATDFGLLNGKKVISVDESWGYKNIKQRFMTEDWIRKRCVAAWYYEDLSLREALNEIIGKYKFTQNLSLGMKNEEVKKLQEVLQQMGYFPANQTCTGYYGGITRKAVLDFQLAYKVISSELDEGAGVFGPKTREKLNSLQ